MVVKWCFPFSPIFLSALIVAICIYSGIFKIKDRNPFCSVVSSENITKIEGVLVSNPVKTFSYNGTYKCTFHAEKVYSKDFYSQSKGNVVVYIPQNIVEAFFPGKLNSLSEKSGILAEHGGRYVFSVKNVRDSDSFLVESAEFICWEGNTFTSFIVRIRALSRLTFRRLMFSWGKAGGLLLALLSGIREYTEPEVNNAFRDSGLSHILALSGMHLSLFGGVALSFGQKFTSKKIGSVIQIVAILFFVWFAGVSPSLFRALLSVLIIYLAACLRFCKIDGLTVISLSFLIQIVIFPEHFSEPAFQLSYASLCGIIILSKFVRRLYFYMIPPEIRSALSDSTSAQLFTSFISVRLFGKIMPAGIIASVFASPLISLFLYMGLSGIFLSLIFPFLSIPFDFIMNLLYNLIKIIVLFFSKIPGIEL